MNRRHLLPHRSIGHVHAHGLSTALVIFTLIALAVPVAQASEPVLVYEWMLDAEPGWAMDGQWEFGEPQGMGGDEFGGPDPTSGYTGPNVYGVNLYGDYTIEIGGPYHLTLGPIDLTGYYLTELNYWRWLNCDWLPWVTAKVEVSNDGVNWTILWENGHVEIADDAWNPWMHDMSAVADNQPNVWIRWNYAVLTTGTWAYSGWNLDDITIWGTTEEPDYRGDLNCDGSVDMGDMEPFMQALIDPDAYDTAYPACDMMRADIDEDYAVTGQDIAGFVSMLLDE